MTPCRKINKTFYPQTLFYVFGYIIRQMDEYALYRLQHLAFKKSNVVLDIWYGRIIHKIRPISLKGFEVRGSGDWELEVRELHQMDIGSRDMFDQWSCYDVSDHEPEARINSYDDLLELLDITFVRRGKKIPQGHLAFWKVVFPPSPFKHPLEAYIPFDRLHDFHFIHSDGNDKVITAEAPGKYIVFSMSTS